MTPSKDQIRDAAMRLAPSERVDLAEELLLSVDDADGEAIDRAWLDEVRKRDAELLSGSVTVGPAADVLERLEMRGKVTAASHRPRPSMHLVLFPITRKRAAP